MSLPSPNNDRTEERRAANQGSEKGNMPEKTQQGRDDSKRNEATEVKLDSSERPDPTEAASIQVPSAEGDYQLSESRSGRPPKERDESIAGAFSDKTDTSKTQGSQPWSGHDLLGPDVAADYLSPSNGLTTTAIDSDSHPLRGELREPKVFSVSSPTQAPADLKTGMPARSSLIVHDHEDRQAEPSNPKEMDEENSQSEIQSIMEQFDEQEYPLNNACHPPGQQDSMKTSLLMSSQHPPRLSSLDGRPNQSLSLESSVSNSNISLTLPHSLDRVELQEGSNENQSVGNPNDYSNNARSCRPISQYIGSPLSPKSSTSIRNMLPPTPDPEPNLPFDFHRFLDQLRHRTADPVAKFLRSFLLEFGKKQWMVHEQVKIINDFQMFITNKMAQCEVWRDVSDAEFDNAKEGMEKLVMNRLYTQTFSPAIASPVPVVNSKGKIKASEKLITPGRRGQHQEDIERDDVLAQKVQIYGWVKEEHLDIPPIGERGRRFLSLACQELIKVKSYRAPRDKVICILNCCKVIFGLLRDSKSGDTSADSFVPLLILVVLQANPDHLISNIQYILRFRNQEKISGESGYYLSSLTGAIQFIENLDRTALTIGDAEFETNVEAAVSTIAEKHENEQPRNHPHLVKPPSAMFTALSEKAELSRPELSPRNSLDAEWHPRRPTDGPNGIEDASEENAAITGLLRTIKKPLSSIGRMFSEDTNSQSPLRPQQDVRLQEVQTYTPSQVPRQLSPALFHPPRSTSQQGRRFHKGGEEDRPQSPEYGATEAAVKQSSAESAEARRIQRAEHADVVETLAGMFPNLDRDVIDDVVREKQGRVGLAVDACLALNS